MLDNWPGLYQNGARERCENAHDYGERHPDELCNRLRQSARANRRDINSEVFVCIGRAVGSPRIDPEAVIARARELRETTDACQITDEELTHIRSAGRA